MGADHLKHPSYPLLASNEAPPFRLINESASARVLLVADHASNRIPRALNNLGLAPDVLQKHMAYDIGTHKLITHLSTHLDASAVIAGYSRLVIDLNRSLEDPTAIPAISDGVPIPGNQTLGAEDRAARVKSIYTPYRRAIDAQLYRFRERGITPALIAIHSFTPSMGGEKRPWHIGLLWDKDPRIPLPLLDKLRAYPADLCVGDNQPYSGKHPADYTIDHHAEAAGLPHVSIEIRQDLVATEEGAERWATILHDTLRDILADDKLYRVWDQA